jgi:ACS family hexuronate transporter-like MFS transporter
LSLAEIGGLTWIPFFVLGLSNIAAGHVSDRLVQHGVAPRKARMRLMLAAAALTPASCLVVYGSSAAVAIGLISLLLFAHGFWIGNFITLIGDTVEPSRIGAAVGLTGTCGGVAGMLSNLVIGPCVDAFGFVPLFAAMAVLYPLAWGVLATGGFGGGALPGKT